MGELWRGAFAVTANVSVQGRICSAKVRNGPLPYFFVTSCNQVWNKSDPEGDEGAKRELKNLKGLKHERLVSLACVLKPEVF